MAKFDSFKKEDKQINKISLFLFISLFAGAMVAISFLSGPHSITTFIDPGQESPLLLENTVPAIMVVPGMAGLATPKLFDIILTIPPEYALIATGKNLTTFMALTNFGTEGPTEVSLTYIITDSRGYVIYLEHEKRIVETQESFSKTFAFNTLNPGEYRLVSELSYFNTSAIASGKFTIVSFS